MTKLHSVHPKKGRGHFDLCLLVILIILLSCGLIILYSATRYTDAKNIQASLFYDHKAGDLFWLQLSFQCFFVKDRLSQAVKSWRCRDFY